ncbi:MAG: carboxypeptidase-like regulatory domain-containing protein [Armatimonadetes bacterium]|nr:carboxypeptidase-like regulatory domain-containing protein [Armatimonadota bacterium]
MKKIFPLVAGFICLSAATLTAAPAKKRTVKKPAVSKSNAPQPNTARGTVRNAQGKPVSDVTVDIWGTATANAGIVNFDPTTNAAGRYTQTDITPGSYSVLAWKQVSYNGQTYRVPMSPVQGKIEDQYLSRKGIARDFVWKISGPIPSRFFDATKPESYYGGALTIFGRDENLLNPLDLPAGSILQGRLVPNGPLMDGSVGRVITFEAPYKAGELYQFVQQDIPVGRYTLSLSALLPDGESKVIRLYDGSGHDDSDFGSTTTVEFFPRGASVRPYQGHFVNGAGAYVRL